jgi:hypothetical protein
MSTTLKRILIVCMVLAGIAVIVGVVYALMNREPQDGDAIFTNVNTQVNTNQSVNTNTITNTNPLTNGNTNTSVTNSNPDSDQESLLRLARIFAERYGTFSNRNNFDNITALEPFMTEAFRQQSAEYISDQQANGIPEEYYGITTTVASLELAEYTEGETATVRVATRRIETKSTQDPTVFTQYAQVHFENVSGSWKVSSANWE